MERVCFLLEIREGFEAEYDRRHAEMWPELSALITESGLRNYTLFRHGTTVVGYAECHPDAETVLSAGRNELSRRWSESLRHLFVVERDEDDQLIRAVEVWHQD